MKPFCLEVRGDFACFTRPEMKVERVSYDVITPSAARAVFESILWRPGVQWRLRRIDVLKPLRWIGIRRNEVASVISTRNVVAAMNAGEGDLALYVEEERQQRAGLVLRDVAYRIYASLEMISGEARANPGKYLGMFERRARSGQCINQPYLGCREFAATFRLVDLRDDGQAGWRVGDDEPAPLDKYDAELGWMLYDLDFADPNEPRPMFFRALVARGVIDLDRVEVRR